MIVWQQIVRFFTSGITLGRLSLPFTVLQLILFFVLPVVLILLALKFLNLGIRTIFLKSSIREERRERILRWIRTLFRLVFLALTAVLFSRLFGAEIGRYLNIFFSFLKTPLLEAGSTKITFVTLLMTIPVFYAATWAGTVTKAFMNQSVLRNLGLDDSKKFTISTLTRYLVIIVILLVGLSIIGIDLSSLAVLFGVLGIGLGFGLQNTVANFFAGITVLFSQPVREGDRILVGGIEGTVVHIRVLSTVISTLTHEVIIIPNSKLVEDAIHNFSYDDRYLIIHNDVQVSYETDLEKALAVLTRVGTANPYLYRDQEVVTRVVSFDDSGISLKLLTWISDMSLKFEAMSWNNLEIWRQFRAEGITIPFPQVDLHIIKPSAQNRAEPPAGGDSGGQAG